MQRVQLGSQDHPQGFVRGASAGSCVQTTCEMIRRVWNGWTLLLVTGTVLVIAVALVTPVLANSLPASADMIVDGCTVVSNPTPTNFTNCPNANLAGADLASVNLSYANLAGAPALRRKLRLLGPSGLHGHPDPLRMDMRVDSSSVPNGSYVLVSEAFNSVEAHSVRVSVSLSITDRLLLQLGDGKILSSPVTGCGSARTPSPNRHHPERQG
jgi:hypothetical protein